MTFPEHTTTARLRGERITADHLLPMRELHANAEAMRTLGGVRDDTGTRSLLTQLMDDWSRDGFGLWWLWDLESGASVGHGGVRRTRVEGVSEIEVAYALLPRFWGKGYATEIATHAVTLARDVLHLTNLVCFTLHDNMASQRVMQKAGFTFERNFMHAGMPHVLYRQVFPSTP